MSVKMGSDAPMSATLVSLNPQIVAELETMATTWNTLAAELVEPAIGTPVAAKPAAGRKRRNKHKG
jgi:hypothetical protein